MFSVVYCGLVFFGGILPRFLFLLCGTSRPKLHRKTSLHVRFSFFGFVLFSLGFRVDDMFVALLCERYRSGSHRTPHTGTFLVLFFFLFCPRRMCVIAHFGRASLLFLVFSRGAILGPARFGVFGFSRNFVGSLAPSEAAFSDARRKGVCILLVFFVVFAAAHARRPTP